MNTNKELELAWEYAEHTSMSIFLTGKAGTGKTTFLRTLKRQSAKTIVVVAPTGVAAINAEGMTMHSFFQLPLSPYVPGSEWQDKYSFSKEKLRIIRALDMLVIDEISMVRADMLDAVDNALRKYRRDQRPFGGVQLLMIGDLQQLAPVVTQQDQELLRQHYHTPYFFGSKALAQIQYVTIELTTVYRQQNLDFVGLLNAVRDNRLTPAHMQMLQSRLHPEFVPETTSDYIRLTTHNHMADSYNASRLARLSTPIFQYNAKISGTFPEYSYPTAECLELREGAQVMFVKNDPSPQRRYYNGKIGHVVYADAKSVRVKITDDATGLDRLIDVEPLDWENARYTVNEQTNTVETKVQGVFTQLPLRLAWAITIHKSQGLTFEHVVIDAGASFAPGQVYVALSRCKSLEGMVLATPISPATLSADPQVTQYISSRAATNERTDAALPDIKREYNRQLLIDLFTFNEIARLQSSLLRVISQNFRTSFPDELLQQMEIETHLREKIIDVADRWVGRIRLMRIEDMQQPEFLQRVSDGARYFYRTISEIFADSLTRAAKVRTENKRASQRVKELVEDLKAAVRSRVELLSNIAVEGFSIPRYLHFKQQSTLSDAKKKAAAEKKKAAAEKKAKAAARKAALKGSATSDEERERARRAYFAWRNSRK